MKKTDIIKENGEYYIVDTTNNIKYQLDKNKCLLKQITDICDLIMVKGDEADG